MIKAGANVVLAPYEVASQFLNSATLRPAVNDFFNSILFDQETHHQITQLELEDDSPWIGKRIGELGLREKYNASRHRHPVGKWRLRACSGRGARSARRTRFCWAWRPAR